MGVSVFIDTPVLFPIPFSSCSFFMLIFVYLFVW